MYRSITSVEDCIALNRDLSLLEEWEDKWLMKFNITKCQVLSVTNKRNKINYDYKLHDQNLQHVASAKYLGVEFTNNLKWDRHISHITSKANKTSAFVWRNLNGCPHHTQIQAYSSLVRPILEYANVVWDPHLKKDEERIEKT